MAAGAQIAETLVQLYNARDRVKAALYEITGIGDIMRGMTNPKETLGAQELKANFATRRIVPQQKEVARFARDLLRLMGAVIAEHFSEKDHRDDQRICGARALLVTTVLRRPPAGPCAPQPPAALAANQRVSRIGGEGGAGAGDARREPHGRSNLRRPWR